MVGNPEFHDQKFTGENYEEFYEHHNFQPMSEEDAFSVNEVIPRFGWAYDVIEELQEQKETPLRVLDLGCLDGSFCLTVTKHLGVHATGIDLTKDGIEIATRRGNELIPEGVVGHPNFFQGSIESWLQKFIDEGRVFDVVTWFEIIEHVDDPIAVQKLIDQIITYDGTILCSTPSFESPLFGMDDEQNKCHVRLYTTKPHDYEAVNKYGTKRKATSFPAFLGDRIEEMGVYSHLINVRYK